MNLYFIHSKSDPCHLHPSWAESFRIKHVCQGYGCKKIVHDSFKREINVRITKKPDISALHTIQPERINIARRDFLELFPEESNQFLKIGNIYDPIGKPHEKYLTFTGNKIILRGSPKSQYFGLCKQCGRPRYHPAYPWHILKGSLLDQPIYECWPSTGLVVTEDLKARIIPGKWKGIYITPVPVVDEPQDGITDMPLHLSDIQKPAMM